MSFSRILQISSACVFAVLTAADTPERLSDPDAFAQSMPQLSEQRDWKEFATEEEIALFEGPEHEWPTVPLEDYDYEGFDESILGSPVPPPGIHPRILFSPEDIPMLKERLEENEMGKIALWYTQYVLDRTLFDPESDDGKQYAKLVSGDLDGLEWSEEEYVTEDSFFSPKHIFKGYKPSWSFTIHKGYLTRLFNGAALLAHFNGDDELGRDLAKATANYWKLREPLIDDYIENSVVYGYRGPDEWRGMHSLVGNFTLAQNYDLLAPWMTEDEKEIMRRVIGKATSGRRGYGTNGPTRWFDTNWHTWDLAHVLTTLSIEGEEGYDPEVVENAVPYVEAFLTWGINDQGNIFEPNGKIGAGLQHQILTMVALARREMGPNLFGHPHLRKLSDAQAQIVVPQGGFAVSNGTWAHYRFDDPHFMLAFYPEDESYHWLGVQFASERDIVPFETYRSEMLAGKRNYRRGSEASNFLSMDNLYFFTDAQPETDSKGNEKPKWDREHLDLSTTFIDEDRGTMVVRTSGDRDALFLFFEARQDLVHLGHNQFNQGGFYLAADGVMWGMTGDPQQKQSSLDSIPRIDGEGYGNEQYSGAVKVDFLGAVDGKILTMATADVKNAWDYEWTAPFHFTWNYPYAEKWELSVDTDPEIVKFFKGTQNWKSRLWDHSYYQMNWGPTMRIKGRPVEYAYRSAGVVHGDYPYVLVMDDLKMDDEVRRYDWIMQLPLSVRAIDRKGAEGVVLMQETAETIRPFDQRGRDYNLDRPVKGAPLLLVVPLGGKVIAAYDPTKYEEDTINQAVEISVNQEMYHNRRGQLKSTKALSIGRDGKEMNSKVLLIPHRAGDELPTITYSEETGEAILQWNRQTDRLIFTKENNRTRVTVERVIDGVKQSEESL
ncbi:MAG: hypothetical protein AAGJ81_09225 [Verrucomicrobiota bacterium]